MELNSDLRLLLEEKLSTGQGLLKSLAESPEIRGVSGITKLEKKIRQELKFLQKFSSESKNKLKKEHLQCSNLQNLSAVVHTLLRDCTSPTHVLRPFPLLQDSPRNPQEGSLKKITVDIVAEDGRTWIKVIARNPKALDLNSSGGNQFGQRSFLDQVEDFLSCARQNTKQFLVPQVAFVFHNGVSEVLARRLEKRGVRVQGEVVPSDYPEPEDDSSSSSEEDDEEEDEDALNTSNSQRCDRQEEETPKEVDSSRLNLDITAMIAYVSALTNGHSNYEFKEPILSQQALWERQRAVKPILEELFRGKKLICCQSAMQDFKTILGTLGGPGERERGLELCASIEVVPDQMSERLAHLDMCRKIKERSLAIFGTGDLLKVLTVTANSGFVRAARGQGLDLGVILHESRALTEDKMGSATEIPVNED